MEADDHKKAAFPWHRYWVYRDPEFIEAVDRLPKHDLSDAMYDAYLKLAKEFAIRVSDVDFVHERPFHNYSPEDVSSTGLGYTFSIEKKYFDAKLNHNITKKQFLHLWEQLQFYKSGMKIAKTKNKPPENSQLLYAIFKALKKHDFPEVYSMYSERKLPGYTGSFPEYIDEDKLKAYYDKFGPITPRNLNV